MSLNKTIVRLFHDTGSLAATKWIIWATDNPLAAPTSIPDFDPNYAFPVGAFVYHQDRILQAKRIVIKGPFNQDDWNEVELKTAYVTSHDETVDYGLDEFVSDGTDIYKTRWDLTPGAFSTAEWEAVVTGTYIETGSIYVSQDSREPVVIDGTFIKLGGTPADYDPVAGLGEISAYFELNRAGSWFKFIDRSKVWSDVPGFVPIYPGQKVARVDNELGDSMLIQTDEALRPTYYEDQRGNGYIVFSGSEHFTLNVTNVDTASTIVHGVPGAGSFIVSDVASNGKSVRVGPTFPDDNKRWTLSEIGVFNETLTDLETASFRKEIFDSATHEYYGSTVTSLDYWFYDDVTFNQDISDWNLYGKRSLRHMFDGASVFDQDISSWNMETVTDISYMFANALVFNQPLNDWDFADLKYAEYVFYGAPLFNQDLDTWDMYGVVSTEGMFMDAEAFNGQLNGWNLSGTINVKRMFSNANTFNQPIDSFRLEDVEYVSEMFEDAASFNQPLIDWVMTKVTDMSGMFAGASVFNQDITYFDTSNVTSMMEMFYKASAFNQPIGVWDVGNVKNFFYMFAEASVFDQPLAEWTTDSATNMAGMFTATVFNQDISTWCVSKIPVKPAAFDTAADPTWTATPSLQPQWGDVCLKYLAHAFFDATVKTTLFQDVNGLIPVVEPGDKVLRWNDLSAKGNFALASRSHAPTYREDVNGVGYVEFNNDEYMTFNDVGLAYDTWQTIPAVGSFNLTDTNTVIGPQTEGYQKRYIGQFVCVPQGYTAQDLEVITDFTNKSVEKYAAGTITDLNNYFQGILDFNSDLLTTWDVSKVTVFRGMFYGAKIFNQDITTWDISAATDLSYMFAEAEAFNQNVSSWNLSNVTDTSYMFVGASSFNQTLVWDTSSVVDMSYMFGKTTQLSSMISLDMSSVVRTTGMFSGSSNFNSAITGPAPNLVYADGMFQDAVRFNSSVDGLIGPTAITIAHMFEGALSFNQPLTSWDVSNVESMNSTFRKAAVFNQELNSWVTDSLVDASYTFQNAKDFNKPLDAWNVGNVTRLEYTFSNATSFNQKIDDWDVRNVVSFAFMFQGAVAYNSPLQRWKTESAESFKGMFQSAIAFNMDISNWDTGTVTDFDFMFFNAAVFNQDISPWCVKQIAPPGPHNFSFGAPLIADWHPIWGARCLAELGDLWYDMSDVTKVFTDIAMTTHPVPGDKVAVVLDKGLLNIPAIQADPALQPIYREDTQGYGYLEFPVGTKLVATGVTGTGVWVNSIPSVGGWGDYIVVPNETFEIGFNSEEVPTASRKTGQVMVYFNAPTDSDLVVLDKAVHRWAALYDDGLVTDISAALEGNADFDWDISKWTMENVTHANYLLAGCENFNVPLNDWVTSSLVEAKGMFKDCTVFNQELSNWDVSSLQVAAYMFYGAVEFNGNISNWQTNALINMQGMFRRARAFNQDLSGWNTTNVTNMAETFMGAIAFNRDLPWDTSAVKTMRAMFRDTEVFNGLINTWDTSAVVDFSEMFWAAAGFNSPLNGWVTTAAQFMMFMFRDTKVFNQPLDTWDVRNVEDFTGMFKNAEEFNGKIGTWEFDAVDIIMDEMFMDAYKFNDDITAWPTNNVTSMMQMFRNAFVFNRTLVLWCVKNVQPEEAVAFSMNSDMVEEQLPLFGQPCVGEFLAGYYDASLINTLGVDVDGLIRPMPGDKVAYVGDISGKDNHAIQTDPALRPEYQEDVNGRGYLIFRNDQHLLVANITDNSRNWVGICGRGVPEWTNQTNTPAKLGIKNTGGDKKVWYWAAEAIATDTILTQTEFDFIQGAIQLRADSYPSNLQLLINYMLAEEEFLSGGMKDFRIGDVGSLEALFRNCVNFNEDLTSWNVENVVVIDELFYGCTSFNQAIGGWDTANVLSARAAFQGASLFNADLSTWVMSRNRNFSYMFYGCSSFNQPVNTWTIRTDTDVNMRAMFAQATAFNQPLSNWDTRWVTNMAEMFWGAFVFNQDISMWTTRRVSTMSSMFRAATAFNQDIGSWFVGTVMNMDRMFQDAVAFDQDISRWCVSQIPSTPTDFDTNAGFDNQLVKQPFWGGFCFTERGEFYHSGQDKDFMFQDAAGTIPVTAPGDPVGFVTDLTGNGRHLVQTNNAARPVYREDSDGNGMIEFGPTQDLVLKYNGRADHILSIAGRGKFEIAGQNFIDGKGIKKYFTPGNYGYHRLGQMAGVAIDMPLGDKTTANNTLHARGVQYAVDAQPSMAEFFRGNVNLSNTDIVGWDMLDVQSIASMFEGCTNFNLNINLWNTTNITNMSSAFRDCTLFNQPLNNWNTAKVNNFGYMFHNAVRFNQELNSWDVRAAEIFRYMFAGAKVFNKPLNAWQTTSATLTEAMFMGAQTFNQNISTWDMSSVTSTKSMFSGASTFNNGSISMANWNLGQCTDFTNMFFEANDFNQNVDNWTFYTGASSVNMTGMFERAKSFNRSVLTWDTRSVTSMTRMFKEAYVFDNGGDDLLSANGNWSTASVQDMSFMFQDARRFNRNIFDWNVTNVNTMQGLFFSANAVSMFNKPLTNWITSNVSNMSGMFSGASSYDQDVSMLDVSGVVNMFGMFENTLAFNNGGVEQLELWDVSNVTDFGYMFSNAIAFNRILCRWNVGSATNMENMFENAVAYNQFLRGWNVKHIATEPSNFGAPNLTNRPNWGDDPDPCRSDCSRALIEAGAEAVYLGFENSWMYQDEAMTTPVTAAGQIVRAMEDSSGNGINVTWSVEAEAPIYREDGGLGYLEFGSGTTFPVLGNENVHVAFDIIGVGGSYRTVTAPTKLFDNARIGTYLVASIVVAKSTANGQNIVTAQRSCAPAYTVDTTSVEYLFAGNHAMGNIVGWNLGSVTHATGMFEDNASFNQAIGSWNTANVTNYANMFKNASAFNQDISSWVTSSALSMEGMFFGATDFNCGEADGDSGRPMTWNTTAVTNTANMFNGAEAFNQDISSWNTANVITMSGMFEGAILFNQPVGAWNTISVTDMSFMFKGSLLFNQNINGWNTANVENIESMFEHASAFDRDLDGWVTTSLTNVRSAFSRAIAFNRPLGNWNVQNVTDFYCMFNGAASFSQNLDTWDVSSAVTMECMFKNAGNFNGSIGTWLVSNVENMREMFYGCALFNSDISAWNTSAVTDMSFMFFGANRFDSGIGQWSVGNVTDFSSMFEGASAFNRRISCWNTRSALSMTKMFKNALSFNQSLSGWCVTNITSEPTEFNLGANTVWVATPSSQPAWGTCVPGGVAGDNMLAVFNPLDISTLWQDTAMTIPVTTVGQPVKAVTDISGNGNHALIEGIGTYQEDVTGNGYISIASSFSPFAIPRFVIPTIVTPTDVSFVVPGVGDTVVSHTGEPTGAWLGDVPTTVNYGPIVFTDPGSGDSVAGYECLAYAPGTITNLDFLFASESEFNRNLNHWDMSQIVSAERMFSSSKFNNGGAEGTSLEPLEWDVSSLVYAESMFHDCTWFNQPVNSWNTSALETTKGMFAGCTLFNQALNYWDVSNVTDMSNMFEGAVSFNRDLNAWTTDNVTDMGYMFATATAYNQDMNLWNTGNVVDMTSMFQNATNFNGNISTWDVSLVEDMTSMFEAAISFNGEVNDWNTASLLITYGTFKDALAFNQPLSNWNMASVWTTELMFSGAVSFNQDLSAWNMSTVDNPERMFMNATSFNNGFVEEMTWNLTSAFTMIGMFEGATSFNAAIGKWLFPNAESASSMFKGATSFNKPLSCWDTSSLIVMDEMFMDAIAFDQDISSWCVDTIGALPSDFDLNAGFEGQTNKQPQWGECPVGNIPGAVTRGQFFIADGVGIFQDAARTVPVTTAGQTVMGLEDRTGQGNHAEVIGSIIYRIDATGLGYLEFTPNSKIVIPTLTAVSDISFVVPGIGYAAISVDDNVNGIEFGGKPVTTYVTQFIIGDEASLSDATNFACTFHPEDTVDSIAYLFQNARSINTSLENWKTANITNMASTFEGVRSWTNANLTNWETTAVTDMQRMFMGCADFNSDISTWDVSAVQFASEMFSGCTNFNQDLSAWTMPLVSNYFGMFRDAAAFNANLNNWDMSGASNLSEMFYGARSFDQPVDTWDVSNVTNFSYMFADASVFDQDLSTWTTTSATDMSYMFNAASTFNNAGNQSLPFTMNNVTTTRAMFEDATSFNIPIGAWVMTAVIDPSYMFCNAYSFNQRVGNWTLSAAETTAHMFQNASAFNDGQLAGLNGTLIDFGLPNNLTSEYTFAGCSSFNARIGIWPILGGSAKAMFKDCEKLNTTMASLDLATVTDISEIFMNCRTFNEGLAPGSNASVILNEVGAAVTTASAFEGCNVLNTYFLNFNTNNTVRDTSRMFASCPLLDREVFTMNMQGVTNASEMFEGAIGFNNAGDQTVNTFFTNTIQNASGMFAGCSSLIEPDLTGWNTIGATDMSRMFENCGDFRGDVGSFSTLNVQNFDRMFAGAETMNSEIGCWNTISATSMEEMFFGATTFSGNLTGWCVTNIATGPTDFNTDSLMTGVPQWGSCPSTNVGGNNVLANLDITDIANMFQDAAMTIPATAVGDPVAAINDTSGNGNHGIITGTARVGQDASGLYLIELDPNAEIKIAGITTAVDIGFNLPSIGSTYVSHEADATGATFWGKPAFQAFGGSILFVEDGSGGTIGGYDCLRYQEKHTTTMAYLFADENSFNQPLANWDVSTITNFDYAFKDAWAFNAQIQNWVMNAATSAEYMFMNASSFDQDVNGWDFSNVTSIKGMFQGASLFNNGVATEFNLTNTASVTDFSSVFKNASMFDKLVTCDFSAATTFASMFEGASSYDQVSVWPTVNSVTTTEAMFQNAASMNSTISFDFSTVTTADRMFMDAWAYNQDMNSWVTTGLVSASEMFRNATVFNGDIRNWNVSNLVDASGMFRNAIAFNVNVGLWSPSSLQNASYMFAQTAIFNQDLSDWNTSSFLDVSYMFRQTKAFNQTVGSWNISNVTNITGMFRGAEAFNQPLNNWVFGAGLTELNEVFMETKVFNQAIPDWDMTGITSTSQLFRGAESFNQPLSTWDVSSVENFSGMFREAPLFNQNIKCWNTGSATNMEDMFRLASSFDQVLTGWCVGNNIASEPPGFDAGSPINAPGKGPLWGVACTPSAGLGATNTLAIFDVTTPATLYQDTARTIPVTTTGQTVLGIEDTSGNGNHAEITGTVYYEENSAGLGYLKLTSMSRITVPVLTQAVDIGFIIPGVGSTFVSHAADAIWGARYWGKTTDTVVGGMLITEAGFGDTISGFECVGHDEKVFNSLDMMFRGEKTFDQPLAAWNITGITSMRQMFQDAEAFNQDISTWDVSSVADMWSMFDTALLFNQDISSWDVGLVTNFDSMFTDAALFNNGSALGVSETPLPWTPATPNTVMTSMFSGANSFNQPVPNLVNTNVINTMFMFQWCEFFNQNVSAWETDNVGTMSNMFDNCLAFNNGQAAGESTAPIAWNTSSSSSMNRMFFKCGGFNQPLPGWTINGIMPEMFNQCAMFNQDLNSWITSSATSMFAAFRGASAFNNGEAAGANTNPLNWVCGAASSHERMFKEAAAFNQPMPNLDTSSSTTMEEMFMTTSFNQPLSHFSTAMVTTTVNMFRDNAQFNQPIGNWNTSAIADFSGMFYNSSAFNQNIQCWNVSSATGMVGMFNNAVAFDQDISSWCVGNNIATKPASFAIGSPINGTAKEPDWGQACAAGGLSAQNRLAAFDPRLMSSLFQDEARTIPVTAQGQFVRGIEDLSGNGNHAITTNTVRFLLDSQNNGYLEIGTAATISVPTLNRTVDVAFVIPGIALAWEEVTNGTYWGKFKPAYRGPITITEPGSGGTVSNYACIEYVPGTVTSVDYTFSEATSFGSDFSSWVTDGILSMEALFKDTSINDPALANWDTSTVDDMDSMFEGCTSFNVDISGWSVANCNDFAGMFDGATAFNQPIGDWIMNTSQTVNMSSMFRRASSFNQDLSSWTTVRPSSTYLMFSRATAFNNGEAAGASTNPFVMDFSGCSDFQGMFEYCNSFNQDPSAWDMSNAFNINRLFANCPLFNQDVNAWDVSGVESMDGTFSSTAVFNNGSALGVSDNPLTWTTTNLKNTRAMFLGALAFNQAMPNFTWKDNATTQTSSMFLGAPVFNQDINVWDLSNVRYASGMFTNAFAFNNGSAPGVSDNPLVITFPHVTNISAFFSGCESFNQDLPWDVSNITNFSQVFESSSGGNMSAFNRSLNGWDVSSGTTFFGMFRSNPVYNQPMNNWNVRAATDMDEMFREANGFGQDLSMWCTPNILAEPIDFSQNTLMSPAQQPQWATMGSC